MCKGGRHPDLGQRDTYRGENRIRHQGMCELLRHLVEEDVRFKGREELSLE